MENVTGAYALYEFLKELVESGQLKEKPQGRCSV